jgi:hypothetical protein
MQFILSLLGLIGLGGIVSSFLTKRKEIDFKITEEKHHRYVSILVYIIAYFDFNKLKYISHGTRDFRNSQEIFAYLKDCEFKYMVLYASPDVTTTFKAFLNNPTEDNFLLIIL